MGFMSYLTRKPIDAGANPSQPLEIPVTPAAAAAATPSDNHHNNNNNSNSNNNENSNTTSAGAASASASPAVDPAEAARQQHLGALMVNLGAADPAKVFGSAAAGAAAMERYRSGGVADLLVVQRPQDAPERNPAAWYKPWTWFTGAGRVSPQQWVAITPPLPVAAAAEAGAAAPKAVAAAETQTETEEEAPPLSAAEVEVPLAAAAEGDPAKNKKAVRRLKPGLPAVDMSILPDAFVNSDKLTDNVRAERAKMAEAERALHETLSAIEETRYTYLTPSDRLLCEGAVAAVERCYTAANREAALAQAAADERRRRQQTRLADPLAPPPTAEELRYEGSIHALFPNTPLVMGHALACAPLVEKLRLCTERAAADYSAKESKLQ